MVARPRRLHDEFSHRTLGVTEERVNTACNRHRLEKLSDKQEDLFVLGPRVEGASVLVTVDLLEIAPILITLNLLGSTMYPAVHCKATRHKRTIN